MAKELPETRFVHIGDETMRVVETKLGGLPQWIQNEWEPDCCGEAMTFLGQFDSLDIPKAELPDSAIVYVFFCRKRFDTANHMQCC